jgi:hypothetical protein
MDQMASHCSGGQSSASHCHGRGPIPGLPMWDLWWTKWNISNIFSEDCDSLLYVSVHQCSIFIQINTNSSVNNTLYFIDNKNNILSGRHVSTFIRSSSGPLRKQTQQLSVFRCIMGSQMLTDCVIKVKGEVFPLQAPCGPEGG